MSGRTAFSVPLHRSRAGERGLTLMELLAAMAIFLGLAGMVLQVLAGGLDLWSGGERSRDLRETASALFDRMSEELRHQVATDFGAGEPRIKFYCDFEDQDSAGEGAIDFHTQRLLFVRHLFEERTDPRLVGAGRITGDGDWFVGQREVPRENPQEETEATFLRATEGLVEVAWLVRPDDLPGHEGRLVLWRALRSPIGGENTLFRAVNERQDALADAEAHVLGEDLLYVGFELLDGSTDDLDASFGQQGGPLVTWDSTRGILAPGSSTETFRHGVGPASLADPDDDVFPRAVRIRIALDLPPQDAEVAYLTAEVTAGDRTPTIPVRNGRALRSVVPGTLVKVGQEWIEVGRVSSTSITARKRGLLGTRPVTHAPETKVQVGRWFERTVFLPQPRELLADVRGNGR